jgi:hypothetical protein
MTISCYHYSWPHNIIDFTLLVTLSPLVGDHVGSSRICSALLHLMRSHVMSCDGVMLIGASTLASRSVTISEPAHPSYYECAVQEVLHQCITCDPRLLLLLLRHAFQLPLLHYKWPLPSLIPNTDDLKQHHIISMSCNDSQTMTPSVSTAATTTTGATKPIYRRRAPMLPSSYYVTEMNGRVSLSHVRRSRLRDWLVRTIMGADRIHSYGSYRYTDYHSERDEALDDDVAMNPLIRTGQTNDNGEIYPRRQRSLHVWLRVITLVKEARGILNANSRQPSSSLPSPSLSSSRSVSVTPTTKPANRKGTVGVATKAKSTHAVQSKEAKNKNASKITHHARAALSQSPSSSPSTPTTTTTNHDTINLRYPASLWPRLSGQTAQTTQYESFHSRYPRIKTWTDEELGLANEILITDPGCHDNDDDNDDYNDVGGHAIIDGVPIDGREATFESMSRDQYTNWGGIPSMNHSRWFEMVYPFIPPSPLSLSDEMLLELVHQSKRISIHLQSSFFLMLVFQKSSIVMIATSPVWNAILPSNINKASLLCHTLGEPISLSSLPLPPVDVINGTDRRSLIARILNSGNKSSLSIRVAIARRQLCDINALWLQTRITSAPEFVRNMVSFLFPPLIITSQW